VLAEYIGSLIQIMILCVINFCLLKTKGFTKQRVLSVILLAGSGPLFFMYIGIIGIFIPVIFLFVINYWQTKDKLGSFIVPLFSLFILVISDHLSALMEIYLFNFSFENVETDLSYMLIHLLMIFFFCMVLTIFTNIIIRRIGLWVPYIRKYGLILALLIGVTIVFIYINILISSRIGFSNEIVQLNSYIFFLYLIFFVSILGLLFSSIVKEIKVKSKQEEYKQLRIYSENLEDMYSELQKFRHDYINILTSMSEYIRMGDMKELESYFNQKIMPASEGIRLNKYKLESLKNIKITEVKGTLVSKLMKAEDAGVDISVEVAEPIEHINIESISLCRSLGILLDNAIEESVEHEDGKVTIAFIKKETSILIIVVNTFAGEAPKLYKVFEEGYSTKGENRGLGLTSLKDIVSTLDNVTLETKIEGNQFFQVIEILG